MIILPAIDLIDGTCVRLTQGEYNSSERVADDPIDTAKWFEEDGSEWIHMVDLDGAKAGTPLNKNVVEGVIKATKLKVEVGGGIRTLDNIEEYIALGVERIILGSVAIQQPELVYEAVEKYGDKIAVGIDAKDGMARAGGWIVGSDVHFIELAKKMDEAGVKTIIYTDISRDGMLSGVNVDELKEINDAVSANVIASGGVRDISDIDNLCSLGVYGAICGRSIYLKTLNLKEAIERAK